MTKTYEKIKHKYFWTNMKRDIEHFINNCKNCQLKNWSELNRVSQ